MDILHSTPHRAIRPPAMSRELAEAIRIGDARLRQREAVADLGATVARVEGEPA